MKQLFATLFSGLLLAGVVRGQPGSIYVNNNNVMSPPQTLPVVDAINFLNNNVFDVTTDLGTQTINLYDFSDVVNFTNRNIMIGNPGFLFETEPSVTGAAHPAANFVNANNVNSELDDASISGGEIVVLATNIIDRGTMSIDNFGLISLVGDNVDVSRSAFMVSGFSTRTTGDPEGIVDNFFGFGSTFWTNAVNLSPITPTTGAIIPTTGVGVPPNFELNFSNSTALTEDEMMLFAAIPGLTTNRSDQIVFVNTPDTNIHVRVLFSDNTPFKLGTVIVEWSFPVTNLFGDVSTNFLYLTDANGVTQPPDMTLLTNFNSTAPGGAGSATIQPQVFNLVRTQPPQYTIEPPGLATNGNIVPYVGHPNPEFPPYGQWWSTNPPAIPAMTTNTFATYEVQVENTTFPAETIGPPGRTLPQQVRTLPGRIEINGSQVLNLNDIRLEGQNYVLLSGTNQFIGNINAAVSSVYTDIYLGSTNGVLTVSNMLQPVIHQYSGVIDVYSGVWSNQFLTTPTNAAGSVNEALYVDASTLTNQSASTVMDLGLTSMNATNGQPGQIILGDNYPNVIGRFTINPGASFTLVSNRVLTLAPSDPTETLYWNDGVPALNSFTNYGAISGPNTMYFEDSALAPDGSNLPYTNFVNAASGSISDEGTVVSADYFENRGVIFSGTGETIITASNAVLIGTDTLAYASTNYWVNPAAYQALANIFSDSADISITCTNLIMTNQFLNPGRALDLNVTGTLAAGTNFFVVNDGINVGTVPTSGDFNLVTVVDSAVPFEDSYNEWAGLDHGTNIALGFTNNASLGRLILDGGPNSAFTFYGPGPGNNALYVDVIEFRNNITNYDANYNLLNVNVQPGMTIYYGAAFNWVGDKYPPANFTTNIQNNIGFVLVKTPLGTNVIHTASEPASFSQVTGGTYDFGLAVTVSAPPSVATVSWNTLGGSENYLYYESSLGGQWQLLTNFVSEKTGTVSVPDNVGDSTRFYRVIATGP